MPPEHERQKVLSPELWTHLFSLQRLPPVSDTLQKCELELASRPRIRSCTPALAPTGGGAPAPNLRDFACGIQGGSCGRQPRDVQIANERSTHEVLRKSWLLTIYRLRRDDSVALSSWWGLGPP